MRNKLHGFDSIIIGWVSTWPTAVHQPLLFITNVGQPLTVVILALILFAWAAWHNSSRLMVASGVILTTVVVSAGLKLVLRRARPETEYVHNMLIATFSFPSGHAAAATVGFGFLAYSAWMVLPQPWSWIAAAGAILFGLLVCVSRIYLGAHYPSDVLGGILLGSIGLAIIILVVRPFS